jgi:hypothetical protein
MRIGQALMDLCPAKVSYRPRARRTFNNLSRQVAGVIVTRAITGHVTEEMTEHYSHVDRAEKLRAADQVVALAGLRPITPFPSTGAPSECLQSARLHGPFKRADEHHRNTCACPSALRPRIRDRTGHPRSEVRCAASGPAKRFAATLGESRPRTSQRS